MTNDETPNTFTRWEQFEALDAYIACALWSSYHYPDEESDPIPFDDVDAELSEEAIQTMSADLFPFMLDNAADLDGMSLEQIGHDLWLTRNNHGAGFWDRGLGERGTRLTDAAHAYGSSDLYLGDDGKIHLV